MVRHLSALLAGEAGCGKAFWRHAGLIPGIPQVMRLAQALDEVKQGLGDVAMVLAFTGLRWEEAVAVPIENVRLPTQGARQRSLEDVSD